MKKHLLRIGLASLFLSMASPAAAGGFVIVGQGTGPASTVDREGASGQTDTRDTTPLAHRSYGSLMPLGANGALGRPQADPHVNPGLGVLMFAVEGEEGDGNQADADGSPYYGMEMGVDYDEFEDMGCGGAQAASGPVGFIPFAVAGLALLFRRRRA